MTIETTDASTGAALAGLTRDDLAALRAADSLSMHHHAPGDGSGHMIRAYLASYGERIYTAREQRLFNDTHTVSHDRVRTIPVVSSVGGYSHMGSTWSDVESTARAFAMVYPYNRQIKTILSLLRAGDLLSLHWTADNNNDNIRNAGFHADELALHVSAPPSRDLWFHLAASVGPDNTARMIKRHG